MTSGSSACDAAADESQPRPQSGTQPRTQSGTQPGPNDGRPDGSAGGDAGAEQRPGDGLEVGVTLAELRAALPDVQVTEGSVGAEWSTAGDGGLAGFLDGTDSASTVTSITAGVRCSAR